MGNKKVLADLVVAILVFVLMLSGIYFILRDIGNGKFCAGPLKTERVVAVESFNREGAAYGSEFVQTRNYLEVPLVSGTFPVDEETRQNTDRPGETMPGLP
jgi:hypothetical protein